MNSNESMTYSPNQVADLVDFKMFTGPISIVKNLDGALPDLTQLELAPRVKGIGSSECEDLAGDRMLKSALEDMCNFSVGSSIWLNHRFDLPDDLFGSIVKSPVLTMVQAQDFGPKRASKPYHAVEIEVEVETENPQAMKTLRYIQKGRKIGFSIGCQVKDFEIRKDQSGQLTGLDIKSVETLEWSTVGLPANTQSWVREAVKGLRRKGKVPPLSDEQEWVYVLKNWSDFEPIEAVTLRKINDILKNEFGLCLARLAE